jgi:hypothetical protein
MKTIIKVTAAAAAVYVIAALGTAALSPRGSSASTAGDETAAAETVQFLNHLSEITTH